MKVRILVFGRLKERFGGRSTVDVELAAGATLREAVRELEEGAGALGGDVAVALNGDVVRRDLDAELKEGDEIVLLPPVSGG